MVVQHSTPIALLFAVAVGAVGLSGCGELDNVTTVKDLRVLAVKSEPAGFLINLDDPGSAAAADLTATVTALVVDPKGNGETLTFSAAGCPDYVDTITSASTRGSKLCPSADVTSQIPPPIGPALSTTVVFPPDMPGSAAAVGIEYAPSIMFGLTPQQVALFFSPQQTGNPALDQSLQYNRDFGLDAVVNLTFNLGAETASAIKRVVYWPRLAPDQAPNTNPTIKELQLFARRNADTGIPEEERKDPVTLSLAAGDKAFVLPVSDDVPESYLLRRKNTQTMQVETITVPRELLTYQFYATAGTFAPEVRQSEVNPFLQPDADARVHIDSQYQLPKAADLPPDGKVTIWVVVRDERAGTGWASRTFNVTP
jgi:hypothetical protein